MPMNGGESPAISSSSAHSISSSVSSGTVDPEVERVIDNLETTSGDWRSTARLAAWHIKFNSPTDSDEVKQNQARLLQKAVDTIEERERAARARSTPARNHGPMYGQPDHYSHSPYQHHPPVPPYIPHNNQQQQHQWPQHHHAAQQRQVVTPRLTPAPFQQRPANQPPTTTPAEPPRPKQLAIEQAPPPATSWLRTTVKPEPVEHSLAPFTSPVSNAMTTATSSLTTSIPMDPGAVAQVHAQATAEIARLRESLKKMAASRDRLNTEKNVMSRTIAKVTTANMQLKAKLDSYQAQIDQQSVRVSMLETEAKGKEELEKGIRELERALMDKAELEATMREATRAEIDALNQLLAAKDKPVDDLTTMLARKGQETERRRTDEPEAKDAYIDRLCCQLSDARRVASSTITKQQEEIDRLRRQIIDLHDETSSQSAACHAVLERSEEKMKQQAVELQSLQAKLDVLHACSQVHKDDLQKRNDTIETLTTSIESGKAEIGKRDKRIGALVQAVRSHEAALVSLLSSLSPSVAVNGRS